jgi:hypothetical protein
MATCGSRLTSRLVMLAALTAIGCGSATAIHPNGDAGGTTGAGTGGTSPQSGSAGTGGTSVQSGSAGAAGTGSGGVGGATCAAGSERCPCYGNGTCDSGLTCASAICVRIGNSGTGGSGGTSSQAGVGGAGAGSGGATTTGTGGTTGSGGTTGTAGTTGAGGTSGNPVCDSVKSFLDGFEYLIACGQDTSYSVLVCQNTTPACGYGNSETLVQGTCDTDKKFTVAGTSSQSCTITLHVQGLIEPKHYNTGSTACTNYYGTSYEGFVQGPANGGATSGCYPTSSAYNVYMMHISDTATPLTGTALTGTRYYWNGINKGEMHFTYPVDYTTPSITVKGGQTLWMLAEDSNQTSIKNCAPTSVDAANAAAGGRCDAVTVPNVNAAPGAAITQPYNGQFVLLHVASAQ